MRTIGVLMLVASSLASDAPCGADLRGAVIAESANYLVAFRTQPPRIAVGMNYRAVVKPAATAKPAGPPTIARYRADGLMFHMPGRWDFYFDVRSAGGTERATRSIVLE